MSSFDLKALEENFLESFNGMLNFLEKSSSELSYLEIHFTLLYLRQILDQNRSWLTGTVSRPLAARIQKIGFSVQFPKKGDEDAQL